MNPLRLLLLRLCCAVLGIAIVSLSWLVLCLEGYRAPLQTALANVKAAHDA